MSPTRVHWSCHCVPWVEVQVLVYVSCWKYTMFPNSWLDSSCYSKMIPQSESHLDSREPLWLTGSVNFHTKVIRLSHRAPATSLIEDSISSGIPRLATVCCAKHTMWYPQWSMAIPMAMDDESFPPARPTLITWAMSMCVHCYCSRGECVTCVLTKYEQLQAQHSWVSLSATQHNRQCLDPAPFYFDDELVKKKSSSLFCIAIPISQFGSNTREDIPLLLITHQSSCSKFAVCMFFAPWCLWHLHWKSKHFGSVAHGGVSYSIGCITSLYWLGPCMTNLAKSGDTDVCMFEGDCSHHPLQNNLLQLYIQGTSTTTTVTASNKWIVLSTQDSSKTCPKLVHLYNMTAQVIIGQQLLGCPCCPSLL